MFIDLYTLTNLHAAIAQDREAFCQATLSTLEENDKE
jgi:hypothetical protein